jgi:hypothetical protein
VPEAAHSRSLTCATFGAVWVTATAQMSVDGGSHGSDGSDGSDPCLRCGGALLPADGAGTDEQEISP